LKGSDFVHTTKQIWKRVVAAICAIALFLALMTPSIAQELRAQHLRQGDTLVVFVHGFRDDGENTWTNPETGANWPDLLSQDIRFASVDIVTFHYPSSLSGQVNLSVSNVAEQLGQLLKSRNYNRYERIIFVAHSMGGLVVRNMLLKKRDLAGKVPLIMFLATPSAGSFVANYAHAFGLGGRQLRALQTLENSNFLEDQDSQWRNWNDASNIHSFCAYEKLRTSGVFVVGQASAQSLCTGPTLPVEADHSGIAKPDSAEHIVYKTFATALLETMPGLVTEPAGPLRPNIFGNEIWSIMDFDPNRERFKWGKAVAFSPDGSVLAVATITSTDHPLGKGIRLLDSKDGTVLRHLRSWNSALIDQIVFSPDGQTLAAAQQDRVVKWDLREDDPVPIPFGMPDLVRKIAFSPDSRLLGVVEDSGHAHVILPTGRGRRYPHFRVDRSAAHGASGPITDSLGEPMGIAFLNNGTQFVTSSSAGTLRLWDISNPDQPVIVFHTEAWWQWDIVVKDDDSMAVFGSRYGLATWDFASNSVKAVGVDIKAAGSANHLRLDASNSVIVFEQVSGSGQGDVHIVDMQLGLVTSTFWPRVPTSCHSLDLAPDGRRVALACMSPAFIMMELTE
jgi:WD40 repeat protein